MHFKILAIVGIASILIGHESFVGGSSYVRPISHQMPWAQWTTTLRPGQSPAPTFPNPTTAAPPPEVTFLPPLKDEDRHVIVTDPNTGQMLYIAAKTFWERFGGGQVTSTIRPTAGQNTPRNPFICDFYARNCWLPNQRPTAAPAAPSRGGGGGSHIYGRPNFHQGAFPGQGEPPRDAGRIRPDSDPTMRSPQFPALPANTPQPGSRGGGGGSHIYGHPNFHQGAFPGPNEPPRSAGRTNPDSPDSTNPNPTSRPATTATPTPSWVPPIEDRFPENELPREPIITTRPIRPPPSSPTVAPQPQPQPGLVPSRGGGGGAHIYGHPNFHQGAFPDPNEPPRSAGRTNPSLSNNNANDIDDSEISASNNWNSLIVPRFGITTQTRPYFQNENFDQRQSPFEQTQTRYDPFQQRQQRQQRTFPALPESHPFFENYNPNNNVFFYTSGTDVAAFQTPVSQTRNSPGGSGIGGIVCQEGTVGCPRKTNRGGSNSRQFTAPPSLRRTFLPTTPTEPTTTQQPKIRVTRTVRPVQSEKSTVPTPTYTYAPKNQPSKPVTTEASPDYQVDLENEKLE